jgi:hypothetical protein
VIVGVRPDIDGEELFVALHLPVPRATIVLNGSTAEVDRRWAPALQALAGAAMRERLTVVTGGTDAGIFSLFGAAMTEPSAPLVGVAPCERDGVPLEPHHTHFVLVEGDWWGCETPALLALAGALSGLAPSVAVVCGGGPVTRTEVAGHVRAGRPVLAVAGSGGVAGELGRGVDAGALVDAVLAALDV